MISLPIERKVLDHGIVALTAVLGDESTAPNIARTSYANNTGGRRQTREYSAEEDAKLARYLIKNRHTTPLEFNVVRFFMVMPIFVARQFVRHRTQSLNEESLRYVEARREFYVPTIERMNPKSQSNKQGSDAGTVLEDAAELRDAMMMANMQAFAAYDKLMAGGLAPELARTVLPLSTYTAWYAQMNLHNLFHMLALRTDPHAQYETRVYAEAMESMVAEVWPNTVRLWRDSLPGERLAARLCFASQPMKPKARQFVEFMDYMATKQPGLYQCHGFLGRDADNASWAGTVSLEVARLDTDDPDASHVVRLCETSTNSDVFQSLQDMSGYYWLCA